MIVKDAFKEDAGRGVVRMDNDIIKKLDLKIGDTIQICSNLTNKKTSALVYPGKPEDLSTNNILLDSQLRRNIDVQIDDFVEIHRIIPAIASEITLTGLSELIILRNTEQLAKKLENRIITIGDILSFYSFNKRVDLVVIDHKPKAEAVRIHVRTKIVISENPYYNDDDFQKKLEILEMRIIATENDVKQLQREKYSIKKNYK